MDANFRTELKGLFFESEIYSEPYYAIASVTNRSFASHQQSLSLNKLSEFDWILYPAYCPIHQTLIRKMSDENITMPKIMEVNFSESILKFINNTNYVTILPKSQIEHSDLKLNMVPIQLDLNRNLVVFTRDQDVLTMIESKLVLD